jgi:hypothetical protein
MRKASSVGMTATKWLGPASLSMAAAILLAALRQPAAERGLIETGVAYTMVTYDQVLPLLGLGIALALVTRWHKLIATLLFVGGVLAGILGESRLVAPMTAAPGLHNLFVYIGPLCCVTAGMALASPAGLRAWTVSAAAAWSGAALGILIALHNPSTGDLRFSSGAAAVGLWLIAAPPVLLRHVDGSWLTIGGRVFASWLMAIGLMLGGSSYVVKQRADRAAVIERAMPLDRPLPSHRPVVKGAPI